MSIVSLKIQLEKVQSLLSNLLETNIPKDLKEEIQRTIIDISNEYHSNHGIAIRQSRKSGMCIELELPLGTSVHLSSDGSEKEDAKLVSKITQILVANSTISARFMNSPHVHDKKCRAEFGSLANPTQQQIDALNRVINSKGQIISRYSPKGKKLLPKPTIEDMDEL